MLQRTDDWMAARCGKVTASRVADVIAKTKSGPSASRANYLAQLVCERLTGEVESSAMQHGIDTEEEARIAYCFRHDVDVAEVGFIDHPTVKMSGASPDGLIGDLGMIEIKCPNTSTHIETLLSGTVPAKHITQMMWQMASTGRGWCDFASYDPRVPEAMRLFVKRVHRDDTMISDLEREVSGFLGEVEDKVDQLRRRFDPDYAGAQKVVDLLRAG
jgi:putative phage-type endonuclease